MTDFTSHQAVTNLLRRAQEDDSDNRELARETQLFLHKKDGQWEPSIIQSFSDMERPRYTFDQCNDLVDEVAGELEQSEFGIKVVPAGGGADRDVATVYNDMVRTIQNKSYFDDVSDEAGRNMIASGFDAWRINQRYGDEDSFDQELFIDKIANPIDSVWIDGASFGRAPRKAKWGFVLEALSMDDYKERFPEGSGQSVSENRQYDAYSHKPETIIIGEIMYRVMESRTIVEMTNGAIYEENDDFAKIKDELAAQGITIATDGEGEERRRKRKVPRFKSRLFDGSGWLTEEQDTVFTMLPIVPLYGNFQVSENKTVYWGIVAKKMDAQRVYNMSQSIKVSDSVLQPRPKFFATPKHMAAYQEDWNNINKAGKATVPYQPDEDAPPPYMAGGPQLDPTLETIGQSALMNLQSSRMGTPGQPVGLRSGVAVELEQNKDDTKNQKYMKAMEVAMSYTGEVLVDAIPRVYDTRRVVLLTAQDGETRTETINDSVFDQQSKRMVEVRNLARGNYSVVMDVAPLFKNRQRETVAAFNEVAAIDPSIMENGRDIWLRNMDAPGMDQMADRMRLQMFNAGQIPPDQMTDEERAQWEQAMAQPQEPQPDPLMVAAQAELQNSQNDATKIQQDGQLKAFELQLKQQDQQLRAMELQGKQESAEFQNMINANKQLNDNLASQISGLKDLIEAFGIQVVGGTEPARLIAQQGANVSQTQQEELR